MTDGEPDFTVLVEGGAGAALWRSRSNAVECRANRERSVSWNQSCKPVLPRT